MAESRDLHRRCLDREGEREGEREREGEGDADGDGEGKLFFFLNVHCTLGYTALGGETSLPIPLPLM